MNDVFISYASQDREWAEKMAVALKGRGLHVFFDRQSLRDGDDWDSQIKADVVGSKHLVCFWSANAQNSPWVQYELAAFRGDLRRDGKLFLIPLDAQRNAFTKTQQLDVAAVKAAYAAGGLKAMSEQDWIALVNRLYKDVTTNGATLQIPVAVLALDSSLLPLNRRDLDRIRNDLGLSEADINNRYGVRRLDWKPFTTGDTIETQLEESRAAINHWLAAVQSDPPETMSWEYPSEKFWSENDFLDGIREFAGRMESGQPGLIIIDPIATSHVEIQKRLGIFNRCLKLSNVAIIAPHPSPVTPQDASFRNWLSNNTANLLNDYVEPRPIPDSPISARFGIGVDDIGELRRLLKTSIGDVLKRRSTRIAPSVAAIGNFT